VHMMTERAEVRRPVLDIRRTRTHTCAFEITGRVMRFTRPQSRVVTRCAACVVCDDV
jgi:hypothetical protein